MYKRKKIDKADLYPTLNLALKKDQVSYFI